MAEQTKREIVLKLSVEDLYEMLDELNYTNTEQIEEQLQKIEEEIIDEIIKKFDKNILSLFHDYFSAIRCRDGDYSNFFDTFNDAYNDTLK
jgi:hypothetical protein